ncbi:mediator of RNA polymerase II transcription subunit 26 isoform X2 [Chelonus insularis]|uniref:mediator of RNA polymerase II transcription subunit 26 isoform X2 n=1 Tax=Chelonus insularis TaxID=460826 RepID=UPI00158D7C11|nr:mediator of RNA polymerase II transcription subunit 26 isoform X2 [Chelonus insularis]
MQRYCTELTEKLLKSLDKEYNVVDMGAVVDVITALEKTTITKEVLEITRLGKYINELRRKTNNEILAKRAKDLVRRWRDMVLPSSHSTSHSISTDNTSLYHTLNGSTKPQSPIAKGVITQNVAITRVMKSQSPILHDVLPSKVISPSLSFNSEQHGGSPNLTPIKQPTVYSYKSNSASSPRLIDSTNQNHSIEAVPRTHSSNKRLRKEDKTIQQHLSPLQHQQESQQRINGENVININPNSQVPSPSSSTMKERNFLDTSSNTEIDIGGPKKRGRKKGSKSMKNQLTVEDQVKEKLASISRNPKLKTTQELLADLQARGSNTGVTNATSDIHVLKRPKTEPPTTAEILRNTTNVRDTDNSTVNNTKFSSMSNHFQSRVPEIETVEVNNKPSANLTVKEILAKLPPLDIESIRWSDDETDSQNNTENSVDHISCPRQITDADVDRLHQMSIESVNGNFQLKLNKIDEEELTELEAIEPTVGISKRRVQDGTNREFREWHEMLAKPSYDGQILHILPYVIID